MSNFVPKPLCCDVVEAFSSEERMKLLMTTIGLGGCAAASVLEKFTGLDTATVRENLEILEKTGFVEVREIGNTTVVRLQKIISPIATFCQFIEEVEQTTVENIIKRSKTILDDIKTKDDAQVFITEFNDISFRLRGIIEIYFPRQFWEAKEQLKLLEEKFAISVK
ncbi:MAG: winged helix-turn-helix domain-containing protein [Candidatus Sifarchaeia archaeon]|jgi:DNA-binding MarR family transcriptional regulator